MSSIHIYECDNCKFYISKYDIHDLNKINNNWIKKHNILRKTKTYSNHNNLNMLNDYTILFMKKYGIDNVRSDNFSKIKLDKWDFIKINKIMNNIPTMCYHCGGNDHFAQHCSMNDLHYSDHLKMYEICDRCKRIGHRIVDCRAITYRDGSEIPESDTETDSDDSYSVISLSDSD